MTCLTTRFRSRFQNLWGRTATVGAALLFFGACTSVLGDGFEVGGGATTGNTSSSTATGGEGGASSTGTGGSGLTGSGAGGATTSTTSTNGGNGGGGPGSCTVGTEKGCAAGKKCSVIDPVTGGLGCVDAGPYQAWTVCAIDTDCAVGLWCDLVDDVCRPICNASDCLNLGNCLEAPRKDSPNGTVTGLKVCIANCEPDEAKPCNQINGPVTCARQAGNWSCAKTANGGAGKSCVDDTHCAPGLFCTASNNCWEWCVKGASGTCTMGTGSSCLSINPPQKRGNTEYGMCGVT